MIKNNLSLHPAVLAARPFARLATAPGCPVLITLDRPGDHKVVQQNIACAHGGVISDFDSAIAGAGVEKMNIRQS